MKPPARSNLLPKLQRGNVIAGSNCISESPLSSAREKEGFALLRWK